MKQLPLKNGKFIIVDDEDFERISKYTWSLRGNEDNFTIQRTTTTIAGTTNISLANEVMQTPFKLYDHKDKNPLNNQKNNIRHCTWSENMCNRNKFDNCTSDYKGVRYSKKSRKWEARITKDGKTKQIGTFVNEVDAAKAYDQEALKLHGEFASLNFKMETLVQ